MQQRERSVRFGVVGAGYGQAVLVPAIRLDPRASVGAIAASSKSKAEEVARRIDVPSSFGDWRALLASESIDALAIAVPPVFQPEIAIAAMKRGLPVFAEKPMATSIVEARFMVDQARKDGLANAVDFNFTTLPQFVEAQRMVRAGTIGPVRHMVVNWQLESYVHRHKITTWKTDTKAGGGTLSNFVSHCMHYCEWLVGPISELSARLFGHGRGANDVTVTMQFEFASGAAGALTVSAGACFGSGHEIELYGDTGALALRTRGPNHGHEFELFSATRTESENNGKSITALPRCDGDPRIAPTAELLHRFVDWINGGIPMESDFQAGLRVQQLIDAARRSDASRNWVKVEQIA